MAYYYDIDNMSIDELREALKVVIDDYQHEVEVSNTLILQKEKLARKFAEFKLRTIKELNRLKVSIENETIQDPQ